jgi:hypothetical protein
MKDFFEDIVNMEDIHGILLLSLEGEPIFKQIKVPHLKGQELDELWPRVVKVLGDTREADLIFEKARLYIRKTDVGYLIVHMGQFASAAMVRLNCDMILPSLKQAKVSKRLAQFFKRGK